MPSDDLSLTVEVRYPRRVVWGWGPLLVVMLEVEMRVPGRSWRRLGYMYAVGVGRLVLQVSDRWEIVTEDKGGV